jgi:hypothetical protein
MNVSQRDSFDQLRDQEYPAPQVIHISGPGTAIVVIAMLAFSLTIMVLASRNSSTAGIGMVGTAIFFLIGVPIGVMASNGGIERVTTEVQRQGTIRRYNDRMTTLHIDTAGQQGRMIVEPAPASMALPAGGVQPASMPPGYVSAIPPISHNVKVAAAAWVAQLFNESTGQPLKNRITPNKRQIQLRSPEPEIVEYLIAVGLVAEDEGRHLYWTTPLTTSTLRDAINTIKREGRVPSSEDAGGWKGEGGVS